MLHAVALEVAREGKPPISATAPWPPEFATLGFVDG
jgi:tRNA pseudouridine32 synthase/23S rRNA pseudouridine746 synthase